MNLKVGSVVRLKSGGPEMTVREYPFKTIDGKEYPNMAECEWFKEEESRFVCKTFYLYQLEVISE